MLQTSEWHLLQKYDFLTKLAEQIETELMLTCSVSQCTAILLIFHSLHLRRKTSWINFLGFSLLISKYITWQFSKQEYFSVLRELGMQEMWLRIHQQRICCSNWLDLGKFDQVWAKFKRNLGKSNQIWGFGQNFASPKTSDLLRLYLFSPDVIVISPIITATS